MTNNDWYDDQFGDNLRTYPFNFASDSKENVQKKEAPIQTARDIHYPMKKHGMAINIQWIKAEISRRPKFCELFYIIHCWCEKCLGVVSRDFYRIK